MSVSAFVVRVSSRENIRARPHHARGVARLTRVHARSIATNAVDADTALAFRSTSARHTHTLQANAAAIALVWGHARIGGIVVRLSESDIAARSDTSGDIARFAGKRTR
jgi:hypothetical protein